MGALLAPTVAHALPRSRPQRETILRIAVINDCQDLLPAPVVDAVQKQITEHFFPIWGIHAELYFPSDTTSTPAQDLVCKIMSETDLPGYTGYHGVDAGGRPFAHIFAQTALRAGEPWSQVLSHEILEMMADPFDFSKVLYDAGSGQGAIYDLEVCDPVEGTAYQIDGVWVSDFVTPQYFIQHGSPPYDYMHVVHAPFTTAPSGSQTMRMVQF